MRLAVSPHSRRGRALTIVRRLAEGYSAGLQIAPPESPRAAWLRQRRAALVRDAALLSEDGPHVDALVRYYLTWARGR